MFRPRGHVERNRAHHLPTPSSRHYDGGAALAELAPASVFYELLARWDIDTSFGMSSRLRSWQRPFSRICDDGLRDVA